MSPAERHADQPSSRGRSGGYYAKSLSAERLRQCYDSAPPRVQRYLEAEIAFVLERIGRCDTVLELGCGYGRVVRSLLGTAKHIVGIDTSADSLRLARQFIGDAPGCSLLEMDAASLAFPDDRFDAVICIQNGISAFGTDPHRLIAEAIRVARPGGTVLFSSYSPRFWDDRLTWFRLQAEQGLIGAIDDRATGDGVIVCTDGFRAETVSAEAFEALASACGCSATITEVDASSMFCELRVPGSR
ncbi:MAG: class I SAM-dependent methyltransferase [Phycisphaerales bacterium]|nr:class I SAM-dependent methyltransferase [Phycisphaerales bacterium]